MGPAVDGILKPATWYVRAGGSNNNGGTSSGTSADRSGTGDGSLASGANTLTATSGAFTTADYGKGICLVGSPNYHGRITGITNSTTVTVDHVPQATFTNVNWAIGGAFADMRAVVADSVVCDNSANGVRPGDTVYVGAGTYRAVYTVGSSFGNWLRILPGFFPSSTLQMFNGTVNVVGDVDGSHTGDAGMVQLTAYTTNDKTAPAATALLLPNGRSNLSFSNIMFVAGTGNPGLVNLATGSQNVTFSDCSFLNAGTSNVSALTVTSPAGPWNIGFVRCRFLTAGAFTVTLPTSGLADYDANLYFTNCLLILRNGTAPDVTASGALSFKGGGVRIRGCTVYGQGGPIIRTNSANCSTIFPMQIYGCIVLAASSTTALSANTSGQVIENYNLIYAGTPRTNITAGANSISDGSYSPLFHFGQETQWGGLLRPFFEPMAGSPLLGFGSPDPVATNPVDLRGFPRPAGGSSALPAIGAFERANTSVQATSPAPPSGTHVWSIAGPGYQDFLVPVDTSSTTISCSVQRDATYAGSLPVIELVANPTIGVTAQSVADTAAAAQNNTITLAAFSATAVGAVTVRVRSRDLTGASVVAFSAFTIT